MPVYNAQAYLPMAIESILKQDFTDFELIILNDGSQDDSLAIIKQYQSRDNRIVLISRENAGIVRSLNEAISHAKGQWVARMDADDYALPNRFSEQLRVIQDTQADICGSAIEFIGDINNKAQHYPLSDWDIKTGLLFGTTFAHPSVVMRKSMIKQLQYRETYQGAEDYDLWVRAMQANIKMANTDKALLQYRIHEQQASSVKNKKQQALTQEIRYESIPIIAKHTGLSETALRELVALKESGTRPIKFEEILTTLTALKACSQDSGASIFASSIGLYFYAASRTSQIAMYWGKWCKINQKKGLVLWFALPLLLMRILRISPNQFFFMALQKFYLKW